MSDEQMRQYLSRHGYEPHEAEAVIDDLADRYIDERRERALEPQEQEQ